MHITGSAAVTVGLHKSAAITSILEYWSDGTDSDVVSNDIVDLGSIEFIEECLNVDLSSPNTYRVKFRVDVSGTCEVEDTEYTVTGTSIIE